MNFKKYHVSRNLLDWSGNLIAINGTVTTNQDVLSSMIDVSNINTLYFTGDPNLMNSGVYRLAKSNSIITSGSTVDSYSSNFTGGSYDVSDCNFLLVTASVYGKPAENAQLIKNSYMCNVGSTPLPYEPYSSEVWHDIPHYIHNTSTDTITTRPAVLYPNDTTATVGLKGQTVQSTTPTPQNPVIPEGTGERTGNLYFKKLAGANISDSGVITTLTGFDLYIAEVEQGVQYSGNGYIYAFFENVPAIGSISFNNSRAIEFFKNIVSPINGFIAVRNPNTIQNAMCNIGNTILPYEPYGYKIPISSASTTTPVYLGEVETTRKIKKYEITGQENWELHSTQANLFRLLNFDGYLFELKNILVCNTYESVVNGGASDVGDKQTGFYFISGAVSRILYIRDSSYSTVTDFKTYLQQQYTAGTPVTVWYILAAPETGVVNEPLMKIGEYADEVTNVSISVTAGGDTLTVDTTVQPSEVTVNYKGWHPVQSAHEKSRNLFDKDNFTFGTDTVIVYTPIAVENGTYTLSTTFPDNETKDVFFLSGNVTSGASSATNGVDINKARSITTSDGYITIATRYNTNRQNPADYIYMLNEGSTALPYEPYWK